MKSDRTISRRTLLRHVGAGAAMMGIPSSLEGWARVLNSALTPTRLGESEPIRLDRNENAYGASPRAIAAMQVPAPASRFPSRESKELRDRIAAVHGVAPEQVVLGCGSTDILRMTADAFLDSSKVLVVAEPTFEWITECAHRIGARVVPVPLEANHSHDLDAMLAACDAAVGVVYICNPNNPTGTLTARRDMSAFVRELPAGTHVVIDEAYHQYVGESPGYASFIDRPLDHPRVIVVRTFSKIYGLAGLRVGYAVCAPHVARQLMEQQLPAGVNMVGARAALAALDDADHVRACVRRNTDDRQEFLNQANARMLRVIDSQTNFVMLNAGLPADQVLKHLGAHQVLVAGQIPRYDTHVRVSLGTPAEMERFWSVWDLLPVKHH